MSLRQSSYDIWLNFMSEDENERDVRINYYFKGPVVGLLMDIDIRRRTGQEKSLDDVMRGLYNRYYKELRRGFTEEEFWQEVEKAYCGPVPHLRALVDTAGAIDYDAYLQDAGLFVDTESWAIRRVENPTPAQAAFLESLDLI
jgi:predicted metalloprotease with PDZ domain